MSVDIARLKQRLDKLESELSDPEIFSDNSRYLKVSQEHSQISEIVMLQEEIEKMRVDLKGCLELLEGEQDGEMRALLEDERSKIKNKLLQKEKELTEILIPKDPRDSCNTIVELRAGAGGDEAALFVADSIRMYRLFADKMGWRYEPLSATPTGIGGFKEVVYAFSGRDVYRYFRHEAGTHRVQRIPQTETQGRIHTSTITVAVLAEIEESRNITIDEADLRIDTYRSSGAGGQHVNTTDSAVRITHNPTGLVVHCQDERSQIKNRAKAMRVLQAKLNDLEQQKQMRERSEERSQQVGTGDRSERIRTYNFPQNRLTDHRVNLTLYSLDRVMEGELESISKSLIAHYQSIILKSNFVEET